MDEFVDSLLRDEAVFGVNLPHIPKRAALEATGALAPRVSAMQAELDSAAAAAAAAHATSHHADQLDHRARSPPPSRGKHASTTGEISLSVSQWNQERAKLGLKPLK